MIAAKWKDAFFQAIQHYESANLFRQAAQEECLSDWTKHLTEAVVQTCRSMGWQAAARGHELDVLPIPHSEYLTLDVVTFADGSRWRFPVGVIELENSRDDERIAYSLWKVLCVRSDLRVVFCYRRDFVYASALIRHLVQGAVKALQVEYRMSLKGETIIVVGSRDNSATFPYGFFKWWQLDNNTGNFNVI